MLLDGPQPSVRERCCWAELAVAITFAVTLALTAPSTLTVSPSASSVAAEPRAPRCRSWCLGRWRKSRVGWRRRWRRQGGPCDLEVYSRDEDLHGAATDTQDPSTWIVGAHNICILCHIKCLRLPCDIVGIITLVGILPEISAHCHVAWTGERSGHMVLRRKVPRTSSTATATTELVHRPSESSRGARHEIVLAVVGRTLQDRPIHLLADLGPTCDHQPSLSSVVGSDHEIDLHVGASHKFGNGRSRAIVPLLPQVKTLCVIG